MTIVLNREVVILKLLLLCLIKEDVTVRTAVTEARIWSMFEKEIWQSWQLPFLIVSCLLLLLLLVVGMVSFFFFIKYFQNELMKLLTVF